MSATVSRQDHLVTRKEPSADYVREFARLVKGKLDPERRVYVEYSNEVWNGQFQQSKYATEQGQTLSLIHI